MDKIYAAKLKNSYVMTENIRVLKHGKHGDLYVYNGKRAGSVQLAEGEFETVHDLPYGSYTNKPLGQKSNKIPDQVIETVDEDTGNKTFQVDVGDMSSDDAIEYIDTILEETVSVEVSDEDIEVNSEESLEVVLPDFDQMTKKEIDVWAKETLNIELDGRSTKKSMIQTIKNSL